MSITPLEQFRSEGFYIARNLIAAEEVAAVREGLHKSFNDQLVWFGQAGQDSLFAAMCTLHDLDVERYRNLVGALWRKLEVYQLMQHERILGFLKEQFGWQDMFVPGGQVVHIMAEELKIPGGYFGLIPHQDFPSVQGSLDGVVVWMPLVDIDRDNYPLEVVPGSHLHGLLPATESTDRTWEVDSTCYADKQYVPVEVGVGDVVFMSLFTVHRSSQRGSTGRLRLALSTRYDNAQEPTFIERCYPSAYVRSVHREQYFQGFPSNEQVADIFRKD